MHHDKKLHTYLFGQVATGAKTIEIRREDDCRYCEDDTIRLREWMPVVDHHEGGIYTGCYCDRTITHVLRAGDHAWLDLGLPTGVAFLSLGSVPQGWELPVEDDDSECSDFEDPDPVTPGKEKVHILATMVDTVQAHALRLDKFEKALKIHDDVLQFRSLLGAFREALADDLGIDRIASNFQFRQAASDLKSRAEQAQARVNELEPENSKLQERAEKAEARVRELEAGPCTEGELRKLMIKALDLPSGYSYCEIMDVVSALKNRKPELPTLTETDIREALGAAAAVRAVEVLNAILGQKAGQA